MKVDVAYQADGQLTRFVLSYTSGEPQCTIDVHCDPEGRYTRQDLTDLINAINLIRTEMDK